MRDKILLTLRPRCLHNKVPEVKISVNNFLREMLLTEKKTFEIPLTCKYNKLAIEFLNKNPNDTKVLNDKIIDDLTVEILELKYRTFSFKPFLNNIGRYTTYDGDIIINTHGFMAFSGTFTVNLKSPLFIYAKHLTLNQYYKENNE